MLRVNIHGIVLGLIWIPLPGETKWPPESLAKVMNLKGQVSSVDKGSSLRDPAVSKLSWLFTLKTSEWKYKTYCQYTGSRFSTLDVFSFVCILLGRNRQTVTFWFWLWDIPGEEIVIRTYKTPIKEARRPFWVSRSVIPSHWGSYV